LFKDRFTFVYTSFTFVLLSFNFLRSAGFALRPRRPRRLNAAASSTNRLLKLYLIPVVAKAAYAATVLFFFAFRFSAGHPLGEDSVKSQTEK
jgi:hypothetical protein